MASKKYVLKMKMGQFLEGEMCSKCQIDNETKVKTIERFKDADKALEALKDYAQVIEFRPNCAGTLYLVKDYYVEECQFDDNGNLIGEGKILGYAKAKNS